MGTKSFNTIKGVVDCLVLPRDVREHIDERSGGRHFNLREFRVNASASYGTDKQARPAVVVGLPIERAGTERFSSSFEVALQLNPHAARQLANELLKSAEEAEAIKPLE